MSLRAPGMDPSAKGQGTTAEIKEPAADDKFFIKSPAIVLPAGGGAIRPIHEKFQVNAVSGTASLNIPLPITKGRGFEPELSLSYDSGNGNGIFGLGWQLFLPSITRKTNTRLPQYTNTNDPDTYVLSGVEDLVPSLTQEEGKWLHKIRTEGRFTISGYRPRIEGSFHRIEKWMRDDGDIFWKTVTANNITSFFGRSPASRIADPADPKKIFKWLPELSYDDKGNSIEYIYKPENTNDIIAGVFEQKRLSGTAPVANTYIKEVRYGNKQPFDPGSTKAAKYYFSLVFDYGEHDVNSPTPAANNTWKGRPDAFSDHRAGFEIRTYRRCERILLFHHFPDELQTENYLVRSLNLSYEENPAFSYLKTIVSKGYIRQNDGSYSSQSIPPLTFNYQRPLLNDKKKDISADDILHAPSGLADAAYQWVDLYNEGISGILSEQGGAWYYKNNLGNGNFSSAGLIPVKPSFVGLSNGTLQLQDIDSNGSRQLVALYDHYKGYSELSDENEWKPFEAFKEVPNIDLNDRDTYLIDLNGDGIADILIRNDNIFCWHECKGKNGYGPLRKLYQHWDEENGARLVFTNSTQSVFLADMNGDGLADILRIRANEIVYWPNLGYGRFGSKVIMGNAPVFDQPDKFDARNIRLHDIDGSGPADLVYLGGNKISVWFNHAGNQWSTPYVIDQFPFVNEHTQLSVTDLLGNGTGCIVWSSALPGTSQRPMKYIDLLEGKKPHLMVSVSNGMGKETMLEYTSSTQFYLDDKIKGTPWITKLPFPVHCLSKLIISDAAAQAKFTTAYTYHHGYYDQAEREFRGFGRVEQTDTQHYDHFVMQTEAAVAEELDQLPVLTKTWFHTGAFLQHKKVLSQFVHEYYSNNVFAEHSLPDAQLPAGLSMQELREAHRACKNKMLRQEIFSCDKKGTPSPHPYTTSYYNCHLKLLQPQDKNRHAVFISLESQSVTYNYEQKPDSPRITHNLNLEIDAFGNVLRSVSVAYGRKNIPGGLPPRVKAEQARTHIVFTQNDHTPLIDAADHQLPVLYQTLSYEITGLAPAAAFFSFEELHHALVKNRPIEVAYHATAPTGTCMRLIEHLKNLFYDRAAAGMLPLGIIVCPALPFESYKLAFPSTVQNGLPAVTEHLFGSKLTNKMLEDAGYRFHTDGHWWMPSGRIVYPANAKQHFYQPSAMQDAFGNSYTMEYEFDLFVTSMQDPKGNVTRIERTDLRLLQPQKLKDANDNSSEVLYDELGMVIASSVYGTWNGVQKGDAPLMNEYVRKPNATVDNILADPAAYLQKATSFFCYDLHSYMQSGKPVHFVSISREKHVSELAQAEETPMQCIVSYSSGSGYVLQVKQQAEPGEDNVARWLGSGRTILNNKGNPVKQYEPFFSAHHGYETEKQLVESGVTPVIYYDPPGRLIKKLNPDGTFTKTVFDAWQQTDWDTNDTVLEDDQKWLNRADIPVEAKTKTAIHAGTPAVAYTDSLGRIFYTVEHNKWRQDDATVREEKYETCIVLDIEGNRREVIDARGNSVMKYHYNMLGMACRQQGMDAGERWTLTDVTGKIFKLWDNRQQEFTTEYDVLRRPLKIKYKAPGLLNEALAELFEYGEGQPNDKVMNLRGKVYKHYDESGCVVTPEYDIRGNAATVRRTLVKEEKVMNTFSKVTDWNNGSALLLESLEYTQRTKYDALNRVIQLDSWHHANLPASVYRSAYNKRGLLQSEQLYIRGLMKPGPSDPLVNDNYLVRRIDYDAKGQKLKIIYGNNTVTTYRYNKETFRLVGLKTTGKQSDGLIKTFQDLQYDYDASGNITNIRDDAQQDIYFRNQVVQPSCAYTYDALYRLILIEGREHIGQNRLPDHNDQERTKLEHPHDGSQMSRYREQYEYDGTGNILKVRHQTLATGSGWVRQYQYDTASNRLFATEDIERPQLPFYTNTASLANTYSYNEHGSMLKMPHLRELQWNMSEHLSGIKNGSMEAWYRYDSQKQRTRKIVEKGTVKEERTYLGGVEIYRRWDNGVLKEENELLQVTDGGGRLLFVEHITRSETLAADALLVRYQYANHLGSAALELNEKNEVISYEEYYAYGATAYQAVNRSIRSLNKRSRYTGMERDDESGLNYHTARYYAVWLGRWVSADATGVDAGLNLYAYANNSPVRLIDITGNIPDGPIGDKMVERMACGFHPGLCAPEKPPVKLTPEQEEARREGLRLGAIYGKFEADLEQFNSIIHRKWGGVSMWDRATEKDKEEIANGVIEAYNKLPQLTEHFGRPEVREYALQGFNEGRKSAYSSASTWNTITNFLVEIAPFAAAGIIGALRNAGRKVVVDLFGGARSQIPGALNVDIAATSGVRADALKGLPFKTGAVDEIIATNPYLKGLPAGSNAANTWLPEAARVLRPGGRITVTGVLDKNKFARMPTAEELEKLGLRMVQGPQAVTDPRILAQKMFTTDGTPIPIDKVQSYVLEKIIK